MNCASPKVSRPLPKGSLSPEELLRQSLQNKVSVDFCTTPAQSLNSKIIIIAAIDISGSNISWEASNIPTDCKGLRRFEELKAFTNNPDLPDQGNYFFRLVKFGNEAASQDGTDDSLIVQKTNKKSVYTGMINSAKAEALTGEPQETNYQQALSRIKAVMEADIAQAKIVDDTLNFIVVFLSDGVPLVRGVRQDYVNGLQNTAGLSAMVSDIIALGKSEENQANVESIVFNTGFYSASLAAATTACSPPPQQPGEPPRPPPILNPVMQQEAKTLLDNMAKSGDGSFTDIGTSSIPFDQFIALGARLLFELSDVWVTNLNSAWWNGNLLGDTDSDGIPDIIEEELKSNPFNADTDGNGVRDSIDFFTSTNHEPCKRKTTGACEVNLALKAECISAGAQVLNGRFKDRDSDMLNDCEEFLLQSDPTNPDSNGDNIPDEFAYRHGFTINGPATERSSRSFLDGIRLDFKLLNFQPLDIAANNLPATFSPPITQRLLNTRRTDGSKTCYSQNIEPITHIAVRPQGGIETFDNKIQVLILENQAILSRRQIIRIGERTMQKGVPLNFTDDGVNDFPVRLNNGQ